MSDRKFTPALGFAFLTPLYDVSVAAATRENTWRRRLIRLLDPRPGDRILDVGCGTGSLAIRLYRREPGISVVGLDPDPEVLQRARFKSHDMPITWIDGFLDETTAPQIGTVDKVTSSLVLHQTPMDEKKRILATMFELLEPGGLLVIADFGLQRNVLMRALFRCTVQLLDGVEDTRPNAEGRLPGLMTDAGFEDVEERDVVNTVIGSISLYTARKGITRAPGTPAS